MKYKIAGVLLVAVMLTVAWAAEQESEHPSGRIHQHETARRQEEGCDCDGGELCTHLPLVLIDTGGETVPGNVLGRTKDGGNIYETTKDGEEMLEAQICVIDREDRNHHPSDEPDLKSDVQIRIRGNSSRRFDKKNYLIRLVDKKGEYQDEEVMGMEPHYEWALHGPWLDKSLMRNYMWYNIAGEIMDYAPNVRFCELILNGEYLGLYVMTETIASGKDSRLKLSEPIEDTGVSGVILRQDRGNDMELKNLNTFGMYSYRNRSKIDIKYPRSGDLTEGLARAVEQDFSDFEKALYSYDYDTEDYGYYHYIDTGSFVDYFLINEFTANTDAGLFSTYFYKDIGERYKLVVWDFNSACDNYVEGERGFRNFFLPDSMWYYMLLKDEYFVERIIDRYWELRETYLSQEYLENYIDGVVSYLGDAVERNFSVWGYSFQEKMLEPAERNIQSYSEATKQMKTFLRQRGEWLDENIETLRQYSHESKNKSYNH